MFSSKSSQNTVVWGMYYGFLLEGIQGQVWGCLIKGNEKDVPVCKELHKTIYNKPKLKAIKVSKFNESIQSSVRAQESGSLLF